METLDTRTCQWCGNDFEPRREAQKFCSNEGKCRMAYHKNFMENARMNAQPKFGTDVHKLYRPDGPDTSRQAASFVDTVKDEEKVYWMIKENPNGITIKECALAMGKFPNQISGRFTALKDKGLIFDSGERRERSRVMKVVHSKENRETP